MRARGGAAGGGPLEAAVAAAHWPGRAGGRWAAPPPRGVTSFLALGTEPSHERLHGALSDPDGRPAWPRAVEPFRCRLVHFVYM